MIARFVSLSRAVLAGLLLLVLFSGMQAHAQSTKATVGAQSDLLRVPPPGDDDPPYNYATFVSQSVPTTMTAGAVYTVTVRMYNSGTTTWYNSSAYSLGSRNPYDNGTWGGGRVALPGPIPPGSTATFTFNVTAPATAGSYNFQWAMLREGVEWFGATSDNVVVNVVAPARVNGAALVAQGAPAQMTAGQTYPVSVVMQNTGNTTWTTAGQYSFGIPTTSGVQLWNGGRVPLPGPVAPGEMVRFNFDVVAPPAGSYTFWGLMVQDGVEWFGASSYIPVSVSAASYNNAQFVSQNVPATIVPGQTFAVTIVMLNNGTTTWTAHGDRGLASANPLANNTWNAIRIDQPTTTAPGQAVAYTFQVTAPSTPGTYNFQWKMVQDQIEWFGAETPNLMIQVAAQTDTVTYVHTDALGSPVARSDSAGNVISRTSYEPYGRTASGVTPTIGFTGHGNDADTGLVYMQQRYYDPVAGRFLSVDPVTTDASTGGSFNRYVYAKNSPYNNVDPDGRNAVLALARVGMTSYRVATLVGAGRLGSAIGIAIYNATHPDPPSVLTPGEENHIINGDDKGGGHSPGLGLPGKSEFPPGWTNDKIVGEISDVLTDPSSTTKPGRDGATIIEGTRDCVLIRCVMGPNGDVLTGYPVKGPGVKQNPKPKPPKEPTEPPKPPPEPKT